jgi:hypothetical protein
MFAGMQRIDLVCLIASPLGTGLLMSAAGVSAGVLGIALWNTAAWYPECALLHMAQAKAPVLQYAPPSRFLDREDCWHLISWHWFDQPANHIGKSTL